MPNCVTPLSSSPRASSADFSPGGNFAPHFLTNPLIWRLLRYRENARNDRRRHTATGQELTKLKIVAVLEKQLRDHEVGSAVDLFSQPLPVRFPSLSARCMAFREAGNAD